MRSLTVLLLAPALALGATSSPSVPSSFGGNGHNASFDGRLSITRTGPGWQARVLRPEAVTYRPDGLPDATGAMWSAELQIVDGEPNGENALAICEPDPARAPYACDASGNPGGPFACYDVFVVDSDAMRGVADGGMVMRRRHLLLRVEAPGTPDARPVAFTWGPIEALGAAGGRLHGIEPTFTRDGKLLVWQGDLPSGGGQLLYSVNTNACAPSGWSAPRAISHMVKDPAVNPAYRIAQRQLRAMDGTPFADDAPVYGAYPWLLPDGDGLIFSSALMACRAENDPGGCGPRRNATSVLGYPTNWGIAHIDGGINPSTTDGVRLFFSSPGPTTFSQLPVTSGHDVWPMFGTNTSNYVEVSFDDGLDGKYAGLWHMNESVTIAGDLDRTRSPDVSGYFNTATLRGQIAFPDANNGVLGKAVHFVNGWMEVAHDPSLSPTSGLTMELVARPEADPDCDGGNNFRTLLRKGSAYSLTLEENRVVQARVGTAVGERAIHSGSRVLPLHAFTKITAEYDAASGRFQLRFDDQIVADETFAPSPLAAVTDKLTIGGTGTRPACGVGVNFAGTLDEVSVSRVARTIGTAEPESDGAPDGGPVVGTGPDGGNDPDERAPDGCCEAGGGPSSSMLAIVLLLVLRRRR